MAKEQGGQGYFAGKAGCYREAVARMLYNGWKYAEIGPELLKIKVNATLYERQIFEDDLPNERAYASFAKSTECQTLFAKYRTEMLRRNNWLEELTPEAASGGRRRSERAPARPPESSLRSSLPVAASALRLEPGSRAKKSPASFLFKEPPGTANDFPLAATAGRTSGPACFAPPGFPLGLPLNR
jgi:hypothetical protein